MHSDDPTALYVISERQVKHAVCDCRGGARTTVTGFVHRAGEPDAVYYAACYPHQGESWIDVILGSWGDSDPRDHATFGCRVGAVPGQSEPACSLVQAATVYSDAPLFGTKLDRERALAHPWLPRFWAIVDLVLTSDPTVQSHVYGAAPRG